MNNTNIGMINNIYLNNNILFLFLKIVESTTKLSVARPYFQSYYIMINKPLDNYFSIT